MGGNDMGFGFGSEQQQEPEEQEDWANAFGGDGDDTSGASLDFAKPELVEIISASTPGQKGASGFAIRGHFFVNES